MTEDIPLFEIAWDRDDVANVVDSVTRGGYWAKGPYVSAFEERLESYLGVDHAVTVNSGTTALVAALAAHGVGEGDDVVVPSFTFIATVNAVRLVGARPVFADIERETFGLDPAAARERVTPETAALLPVHPYGASCDLDGLTDVADEHDLALIEDAAEALGADADGRMVGTVGDSAALSFCQNKVVATGEGGAVVTDDPEVAESVRLFRSHGRSSEAYFDSPTTGQYTELGGNFRMPDVVAAIGCAQMEKVEDLVAGRRAAALRMNEALEDVPGVRPHRSPHGRHVYQLYTVALGDDVDRAAVVEALDEQGVASKVYWDPPAHRTESVRDALDENAGRLPVTDDVASRVLSLPVHPNLTARETERIADALRAGVERARASTGAHRS